MDRYFKITSTNLDYVVKSVNYHLTHGDRLVSIKSGRKLLSRKEYLSVVLERPEASIVEHKKVLLGRAIADQDFKRAATLRDELTALHK